MKTSPFKRLMATVFLYVWALASYGSTKDHLSHNDTSARAEAGIVMLVTFHVKVQYRRSLQQALAKDVVYAKKEPGNVTMELYRHKENENIFYLFERWTDQEALDRHFEMPYTQAVLKRCDRALTTPMQIDYLKDISPIPFSSMKLPEGDDKPINLFVFFEVKEGRQQQFIDQFAKSVENSRSEPGNIHFHFHKVLGQPNNFVLYERWRNQEVLDTHFEKPYTKELFTLFETVLYKPVIEDLHYVVEIKD